MSESQPLVTPESVSAARQALLDNGQRVTQRNVIRHLGGGSFSTVGPLLQALEKEHGGTVAETLPELLEPKISEAAVVLWKALAKEADKIVDDARAQFERDKRTEQRLREEAERLLERTQEKLLTTQAALAEQKGVLENERLSKEQFRREGEVVAREQAVTLARLEEKSTRAKELETERNTLQQALESATALQQIERDKATQRIEDLNSQLASAQSDSETKLTRLFESLRETEINLSTLKAEQAGYQREIDNLSMLRDGMTKRLDTAHATNVEQEGRLRAFEASCSATLTQNKQLEQALALQRADSDKVIAKLEAKLLTQATKQKGARR